MANMLRDQVGTWLEDDDHNAFVLSLSYCYGGVLVAMLPVAIAVTEISQWLGFSTGLTWIVVGVTCYPVIVAPLMGVSVLRDGRTVREAAWSWTFGFWISLLRSLRDRDWYAMIGPPASRFPRPASERRSLDWDQEPLADDVLVG